MIKKYLNTFKGYSTQQRARRFGFTIFTLLFALLFSIYFTIDRTFTPTQSLGVSLLCGFTITLIIDLIAGIGRKSPLIK